MTTKFFGVSPAGDGKFAGLFKAVGEEKDGWEFFRLGNDGSWVSDPSVADDIEGVETNSMPVSEISEQDALRVAQELIGSKSASL